MTKVNTPHVTTNGTGKASEAFFESIAMGGPSLVAIIRSTDFKIIFVNTQFENYLGYSGKDLEGDGVSFTDLLDEYLIDRLQFQLNMCLENMEARSRYVVYRLRHKDGSMAPFYVYAAPAGNDASGDMFHLVMHPDLSKWFMPFTSFNSRELFLEHFNSDAFGTFEWLMDVDKVFWSIGVYHIYEVDDIHQQITNEFAQSFVHAGDKAKVTLEMEEAFEQGRDVNVEFRIITAKNNIKIIHSLGRIIRNREGRPVKFAGSIRDVTEQRQIEQDLKNKVAELNHSNKELEEFAYVASHDMQEPLRKITTFSDRLSEKYKDVLTGEGLMYLSRMIASAENMRSLINDLLDFSRISKTSQPFEQVSLNVILRQIKTDLELSIEETGTEIISQALPKVDAIASQMKQLFTNVINNAIKFHKPDVPPVINIETSVLTAEEIMHYELAKNTAYYKIQVTDNGIGFEEEYATRIFQVFQRLHGKSEYPGSGIGLAICKKIMEYHNGMIFAENMEGVGARFTIILPHYQKPKAKNL